jgi:hypothetical protein
MKKSPSKSGHNIVRIPAKPPESGKPDRVQPRPAAADEIATAGSLDDPRMKEALRLMEAFLAIEDADGRAALVALAERLVSYDWVRKTQRR